MAALNIPITPSQWEHRNKNYTGVQFQEGTPVLARELNYFQQISGYNMDSLFRSILGPMFLGDAFEVTAVAPDDGNENSISIKSGKFYCPLGEVVCESDKRYTDIVNLDHYDNDTYVRKATWNDDSFETYSTDISTPTTQKRTDLVILVITRVNIDSSRDSGIIDTALGSETATRLKLYYTLKYVKGGTLSTWASSFAYEDPGVFRLPIASIDRTNADDFIYQSQIVDQRSYAAEAMAVPMYKRVTNYIASKQGSGNGFNADTVDNRHVNDLLDDIYSLWSASKIKQFVSDTAKGLIPQAPVKGAISATDIPTNPPDGERYICLAEDITKPTFKLDYIYEYSLSLGAYVETEPQQGFLLQITDDQVFVLYSELALNPPDPDYGSHWFNFGGINDHATLNNVLKADDTSTENTIKKHVTDLQVKTIVDRLSATESIANTVTSDLSTHRLATTLDHPVNSVLDSHIAAITIDPTLVGTGNTARLTVLLSNIAKALHTITGSANWYTGVLKANLSGDTFTGIIRSTDATEASLSNASIITEGGITAKKLGYFHAGIITAGNGIIGAGLEIDYNNIDSDSGGLTFYAGNDVTARTTSFYMDISGGLFRTVTVGGVATSINNVGLFTAYNGVSTIGNIIATGTVTGTNLVYNSGNQNIDGEKTFLSLIRGSNGLNISSGATTLGGSLTVVGNGIIGAGLEIDYSNIDSDSTGIFLYSGDGTNPRVNSYNIDMSGSAYRLIKNGVSEVYAHDTFHQFYGDVRTTGLLIATGTVTSGGISSTGNFLSTNSVAFGNAVFVNTNSAGISDVRAENDTGFSAQIWVNGSANNSVIPANQIAVGTGFDLSLYFVTSGVSRGYFGNTGGLFINGGLYVDHENTNADSTGIFLYSGDGTNPRVNSYNIDMLGSAYRLVKNGVSVVYEHDTFHQFYGDVRTTNNIIATGTVTSGGISSTGNFLSTNSVAFGNAVFVNTNSAGISDVRAENDTGFSAQIWVNGSANNSVIPANQIAVGTGFDLSLYFVTSGVSRGYFGNTGGFFVNEGLSVDYNNIASDSTGIFLYSGDGTNPRVNSYNIDMLGSAYRLVKSGVSVVYAHDTFHQFYGDVRTTGNIASGVGVRGALAVTGTRNAGYNAMQTNLMAMQAGDKALIFVGKNTDIGQCGYIGYDYTADDNDSNHVAIGHFGKDSNPLRVYQNGDVSVTGDASVVGTLYVGDNTGNPFKVYHGTHPSYLVDSGFMGYGSLGSGQGVSVIAGYGVHIGGYLDVSSDLDVVGRVTCTKLKLPSTAGTSNGDIWLV